jgi:hypothetical protein
LVVRSYDDCAGNAQLGGESSARREARAAGKAAVSNRRLEAFVELAMERSAPMEVDERNSHAIGLV